MENLRSLKNEILKLLVENRKLDRDVIMQVVKQDERLANAVLSDFEDYELAKFTKVNTGICKVLCIQATDKVDNLYYKGGFTK
jgi:hypothetical protein